jgi:hypothetical protein
MTRSTDATVRGPRQSTAPLHKTCTWCHTGWVNRAANGAQTAIIVSGRGIIIGVPFLMGLVARVGYPRVPLPTVPSRQDLKMAKVEDKKVALLGSVPQRV